MNRTRKARNEEVIETVSMNRVSIVKKRCRAPVVIFAYNMASYMLEDDFGMEVAHKRMRLPSIAADVAYYVDAAIQAVGLYHQKIHVLSEMNKNIACSIDKARNELGYEPKIALREGMRRSIQWCLEQGHEI